MRVRNPPLLAMFVGKEQWGEHRLTPCTKVVGGPDGPQVLLQLHSSRKSDGFLTVTGKSVVYMRLHPDAAYDAAVRMQQAAIDLATMGPDPMDLPVWGVVRMYWHKCETGRSSTNNDRTTVTILVNRERRPIIRIHRASLPGTKREWGNMMFCDTPEHAKTVAHLLRAAIQFIVEETLARAT